MDAVVGAHLGPDVVKTMPYMPLPVARAVSSADTVPDSERRIDVEPGALEELSLGRSHLCQILSR